MRLQEFIHSLEQGGLAKWIRIFVILAIFALGYTFFVLKNFRGLTEANGMDQAQIAREIARGNGFTTKNFRPLAIAQFQQNKEKFPIDNTPETFHAPLNPYLNSLFLRLTKSSWNMTTRDLVYPSDRMIATVSVTLMMLGMTISYLTARRIFDAKISSLAIGLVLISNQYWGFALSGLPQMLMFFLFSICGYVLFRAIETQLQKKNPIMWLAIAGLMFGLLALTHALTIWLFVGAFVFAVLYFTPRFQGAAIMLAVFLLVWAPWMARNYSVCGNAFGVSHYAVLGAFNGSEMSRMRSQDLTLYGLSIGGARGQIKSGFIQQTSQIFNLLGQNFVAPVFFIALLYIFKRREASDFRWCIFIMWMFAFLGVSLVGLNNSNNLFILFVPMLTLYGFAYVMMLWARLEINIPLFRYAFIIIIYALSGIPIISTLTTPAHYVVNWPPYVPPFVAILNTWTTDTEVIASDMPWAVAWYADRKSLHIPVSISDFLNLYDWSELTGNLVGLYLTPITGNRALISEVVKGEDKDWAPFVIRGVRSKDFPFHASTALPIDNECVFYCESDRWSQRAD